MFALRTTPKPSHSRRRLGPDRFPVTILVNFMPMTRFLSSSFWLFFLPSSLHISTSPIPLHRTFFVFSFILGFISSPCQVYADKHLHCRKIPPSYRQIAKQIDT
ncbi:hypothetical protein JAAARDRAFT_485413 [Jaapia argillacea MUCL 33604]|uniref:Uncharacterized protein n=1 Tax=Jaapia argillacea MUCL 33604 TaxID=933084 RepID=A0A067PPG6_9AGAM|nr:hypothetical protein JAAARDRAFT_485413 [Jaapia argillacea MUCL 33604]